MISQIPAAKDLANLRAANGLSKGGARPRPSLPDPVDYVPHQEYRNPGTEERLFAPDAPAISVPPWRPPLELDEQQEEPALAKAVPHLTRQDEAILFMRYNYARYRLSALVEKQRRRFAPSRALECLTWSRRAHENRSALTQANMGLVLAMVKRMRVGSAEYGELVSEGNMALLRTVDKFDVARGFKFSTYACGAILRALSRLGTKVGTYRQRFPVNFAPEMERSDELERRRTDRRELALDDLRQALIHNRAGLTDAEKTVLGARFGVVGQGRAQTLQEVSKILNLSTERVRQVQKVAVAKLRVALTPQDRPTQEGTPRIGPGICQAGDFAGWKGRAACL